MSTAWGVFPILGKGEMPGALYSSAPRDPGFIEKNTPPERTLSAAGRPGRSVRRRGLLRDPEVRRPCPQGSFSEPPDSVRAPRLPGGVAVRDPGRMMRDGSRRSRDGLLSIPKGQGGEIGSGLRSSGPAHINSMNPWISHRAELSKCPVIPVQVDPFSTLGTSRGLPTGVCTDAVRLLETSGAERGGGFSEGSSLRNRVRAAQSDPNRGTDSQTSGRPPIRAAGHACRGGPAGAGTARS